MTPVNEADGLHDTAFDVLVVGRSEAATGVVALELAPSQGATLPAWTAGAHIDLLLPDGEVRQYSLSGDPGAGSGTWRICVLREPEGRGGSAWVHEHLHPGVTVRVAGPRNHFEFEPRLGTGYVFIAGGIGITPIAAMAAAAQRAGVAYRIEYSGRSRAHMALLDELVALHGDRLVMHISDEGNRLDLDAVFRALPPFTTTFCCGPERLVEATELASAGRQLVVERFAPKMLGAPVRDEPFEVELAATGVTVLVPPDRSILEVAEDAGAFVLSSCREGTCGTCETTVLDGDPDHRDSILTPDEQEHGDIMYVCVSRSRCPRLVLDL